MYFTLSFAFVLFANCRGFNTYVICRSSFLFELWGELRIFLLRLSSSYHSGFQIRTSYPEVAAEGLASPITYSSLGR